MAKLSTKTCPPEQAENILLLAALTAATETAFFRLPPMAFRIGYWQKIAGSALTSLVVELTSLFDDEAHAGHAELGSRAFSATQVAMRLPDAALKEWLADGIKRALAAADDVTVPAAGLENGITYLEEAE